MDIEESIGLIANISPIIGTGITVYSFYKAKGDATINIYEAGSPPIITPTEKSAHKSTTLVDDPRIAATLGLILLVILLFFYSLTYKLIPALFLFLFSILLLSDIKIPFVNKVAKFQWGVKRGLTLIPIILLFFTPRSILNILEQLPMLNINTFAALLDSFIQMFKQIYILSQKSILHLSNIVFRTLGIFILLIFIFKTYANKIRIHKIQNRHDFTWDVLMILIIIMLLNVELYWNLIEPIRVPIQNWFIADL